MQGNGSESMCFPKGRHLDQPFAVLCSAAPSWSRVVMAPRSTVLELELGANHVLPQRTGSLR